MSNTITIWRKELQSYFRSPIAYGVMAFFALISGYFFYVAVVYFVRMSVQSSMMCATGFSSSAWASQPRRNASSGMAPPPANMSSTFGRGARPCSMSSTVTVVPVSFDNR